MCGVREVMHGPAAFRRYTVRLRVGEAYHPARVQAGDTTEQLAELSARIGALLPPEHRAWPARPLGATS
jgi:hypothetical protein